jgi:hypothetical protein
MGYLMTLSPARLYSLDLYGDRWIEENIEGSDHGLIKVLSQHLLEDLSITMKKAVRIADILAKIRTDHLPGICWEHYCYANTLGSFLC